jgi:hypothetical protein
VTETESIEEAREKLARELWWEMYRLDPPEDETTWEELSECKREFYRVIMSSILRNSSLILRAI